MRLPYSLPSLNIDVNAATLPQFASAVVQMFQRVASAVNNPDAGATADRPASQLVVGQIYFDTTLGKPVWWSGAVWVDASGTPA